MAPEATWCQLGRGTPPPRHQRPGPVEVYLRPLQMGEVGQGLGEEQALALI